MSAVRVAVAGSSGSIGTQTLDVVRAEPERITHAIARLSPGHREVLALRELEGESYQSIAAIVHIPVGTVMSRLHHARKRLAAELELPQAA